MVSRGSYFLVPTTSELQYNRFPSLSLNYVGPLKEPPYPAWTNSYLKKTSTVTKGGGVPQWRRKIAMGKNCTTTLTGLKYSCVQTPGRAYLRLKLKPQYNPALYSRYKVYDRVGYFSMPIDYPIYSVSGDLVTEASNTAKQAVMKKIISQQQAFQALVFAGEGRQTVRMIQGASTAAAGAIRNYLLDVKKRSRQLPRGLTRRLDALAGMWLGFSYGLVPLLSDMDSGAEALAEDMSIYRHQLVTGFGEVEGEATRITGQTVEGGMTIGKSDKTWSKVVVIYRAMVDLERSTQFRKTATNLGVSLSSFLPSIYELIPYSFLLDYFTNVNEIVNAWSWGRSGLGWSSRTEVSTRIREVNTTYCKHNPAIQYDVDDSDYRPCSLITSVRQVNRDTYYGDFVPSLEFELPKSATKLANLGALGWLHTRALREVLLRR